MESYTYAPCILDNRTFVPDVKCSDDIGKKLCLESHGTCQMDQDGYYIVGGICVAFGFLSLMTYIRPLVRKLESISSDQWKLKAKVK